MTPVREAEAQRGHVTYLRAHSAQLESQSTFQITMGFLFLFQFSRLKKCQFTYKSNYNSLDFFKVKNQFLKKNTNIGSHSEVEYTGWLLIRFSSSSWTQTNQFRSPPLPAPAPGPGLAGSEGRRGRPRAGCRLALSWLGGMGTCCTE